MIQKGGKQEFQIAPGDERRHAGGVLHKNCSLHTASR
jgi:hypothetical protein